MSSEIQPEQPKQNSSAAAAPLESVAENLSLPKQWDIADDPQDGLLLIKNQDGTQWESISLDVSHRKNGDRIRVRHRKAPYRRGRVGRDPVERETVESLDEAVKQVKSRIQ